MSKSIHLVCAGAAIFGLGGSAWAADAPAAETPAMKAARPERGSHAPGTFWYYNNWDFNVLGTVFEKPGFVPVEPD